MKKKIFSLFLAAVMVLSMMVVVPISVSAEGNTFDATNYDTTETFTISTAEDLVNFADYLRTAQKTFKDKIVNVENDITLSEAQSAAWQGIGNGDNSEFDQHFEGTFNGNGHTIDLGDSVTVTANHKGGLFRGLSGGAVVKNFKLLGKISIDGDRSSVGAVVCRLRGTVTLENIHCSVDITNTGAGDNSKMSYCGGLVGFIHNDQTTDLTINGCIYDGDINCNVSANNIGGLIGYTGKNSATKNIRVKNTVFAGQIMLSDPADHCSTKIGGLIGYVPSNANNAVNIYLDDVMSIGQITFAGNREWTAQQRGVIFGNLAGDTDDTYTSPLSVYPNKVYYIPMKNYDNSELPLYGASNLSTSGGSMTRLKNNTFKKTATEIADLSADDFSDGAVFSFKASTYWDTYYPCPSYFAQNGAWVDSLKVSVDAKVLGAQIRYNNDATLYSGIRFVAEFKETLAENIGNADANFGLILISKTAYDGLTDKTSFEELKTAGVQVPAIMAETKDGIVTVKAVVYNIDEEDYDKEIVAIPYINGAVAGDALPRSIYYVANECVNDESDEVDPAAKEYSQGIVDYVTANTPEN